MSDLVLLFFTGLIAAGTPGPDILLLIRTAILANIKKAFIVLSGILIGNAIMLAVVYLGLGFIGENQYFQMLVQILGSFYLFYLSYQIYIHRNDSIEMKQNETAAGFKEGFIVNLSNPKAMLFFTVVITPFLNGDYLFLKVMSLGAGIVSAFVAAIFLAAQLRDRLLQSKMIKIIDLTAASLFLFFGVSMILRVIYSNVF